METIRTEIRGKLTLRMVKDKAGYSGVILSDKGRQVLLQSKDQEALWHQLEQAAAQSSKDYVGFAGARTRFLQFFPDGFESAWYHQQERRYKIDARGKLQKFAPLDRALRADGMGKAVLEVYRGTNLIEPRFELRRVENLLRSPSADAFIRAAAQFAVGPGASVLAEVAQIAKPYECAKWAIVSYLPFMWLPERHMFLKPEVTKDFAGRVGHNFLHTYSPALEMAVYDTLLDLVTRTEREIADLHPRDRVDVQSFIWVVGKYEQTDLPK